MTDRIHPQEIRNRLTSLKNWTYSDNDQADFLQKSFTFRDFTAAWEFMTRVAALAETADHHPEWSNVYNKVEIKLSTHDSGGVSEKDFSLASAIDKIS